MRVATDPIPTRSRRARSIAGAIVRVGVPLILCAVGVSGLVGCFYVPSSYRYQPNGQPRPESLIGRDELIRLGSTDIVDAMVALHSVLPSLRFWDRPGHIPVDRMRWFGGLTVSRTHREIAIPYGLTVGTLFFLECFIIPEDRVQSEQRYLVLKLDDEGRVIDSRTLGSLPENEFGRTQEPQLAGLRRVLSETRLRRLQSLGAIDLAEDVTPATTYPTGGGR